MVKPKMKKALPNKLESQTLTELRDWVMSAGDEWANTNSEVGMMKDEGGTARLADVHAKGWASEGRVKLCRIK